MKLLTVIPSKMPKMPCFERWATWAPLGHLRQLIAVAPFTRILASWYIDCVTSVKRDRDWTPVESAATKAAVSAMECGFAICAPFMVARWASASLAGSRKRVPGSPTHRVTALFGLRAVVFVNRTRLEAFMATSLCATAPTSPASGNTDPIQLHAQAHNALSMALHYLSQPNANVAGARRKAIQALSALRGLDLSLEG